MSYFVKNDYNLNNKKYKFKVYNVQIKQKKIRSNSKAFRIKIRPPYYKLYIRLYIVMEYMDDFTGKLYHHKMKCL